MNFNEIINQIKSELKNLLDTNTDNKFIEKVSSLDKQIDNVVTAHEETTKELHDTKDSFVKYVKEVGFSKPSNDDPTKVDTPKSIDEIMQDKLNKFKEEK